MKKLLLQCLFLLMATTVTAQITLGSGTTTGTYPIASNWGYNYTQQIISKTKINAAGPGSITGLKFYLPSSAVIDKSNQWEVFVGHTTLTAFAGTTAASWIPTSGMTQVFTGVVTNNAGVVEVTFTAPFAYNNTDNLVVAVHENTPLYNSSTDYFYTSASGTTNSSMYYRNDTTDFNPAAPVAAGGRAATLSNITLLGLTPSPVPSCPTVSSPAAAATGVSVTPAISWAAINNATGYRLSVGTTAGGTDIMNNVDLGNVLTYTLATPLNFNTQYFYTLNAYNGAIPSVSCSERSFTTGGVTCPAVTAPIASATGVSTTPTISWTASPGATGYRISMGTTSGGTNVLNNVDVGNVTTYTLGTALATSTTYYYTVNAYSGALTSSSCTVRSFTTPCLALTPNYTNNFAAFPGACWSQVSGGSPTTGLGTGTSTYWFEDGFLNVGTTGAAKINLYSTARAGWLLSPAFNLTAGGYRVKFEYGVTTYAGTTASAMGSDDVVQFAVSTNGGTSWTVLQTWNAANTPTNTTNQYSFDLANYIGANTMFALFGSDGTVDDTQDYEFFVDNFTVETIPTCDTPIGVTSSAVTSSSSTLSWTAPAAAPANGYQYSYSTTNTAPASGTATTATTVNLSTLAPSTTYYYWVRSMCSGSQSTWITGSFTTMAAPPSNDNCTAPTSITPGATFAQNPVTGTTVGATLTTDATAVTACQSTRSADTWYSVVVPASGNITIETKSVTGSPVTDTVLAVYTGSCGALTSVGCDDDSSTDGNFSLLNLTSTNGITPGQTLLIGVWNYSSSNNGTFQISAYDASLATSETAHVKNNLTVYPNPFADVLNISDVKNVKSVSVIDVAGRLVKTIEKPNSALQLGDLKSGMYVVVLNMNDGSKQTIKAIKK